MVALTSETLKTIVEDGNDIALVSGMAIKKELKLRDLRSILVNQSRLLLGQILEINQSILKLKALTTISNPIVDRF